MANQIKKSDRLETFTKYNGKCAYCGIDLNYSEMQIDHIIPRRRSEIHNDKIINGKNHILNYNPSCKSCNSSKSTFSIEDWRKQIKQKINSLRRDSSTFRICERFNLVKVENLDVIFYFEKV
jgi:5-methylcytosine-specific restriction endonuclease McrA